MFKLNSGKFPIPAGTERPCIFGGEPNQGKDVGQSFVWASSDSPALQQGDGLLGTSLDDPLGATFAEVVRSRWYYVVWNDASADGTIRYLIEKPMLGAQNPDKQIAAQLRLDRQERFVRQTDESDMTVDYMSPQDYGKRMTRLMDLARLHG